MNEWHDCDVAGSLSVRSQLESDSFRVAIPDHQVDPSGPLGLLLHFLSQTSQILSLYICFALSISHDRSLDTWI